MAITKKDIINNIYMKFGLTRLDCVVIVEAFFEIIKKELANGNDVMISGFGKWSVRIRRACACRNPQTGETMQTNERVVVTFKNSPKLKKNINREGKNTMERGGIELVCENRPIYLRGRYLNKSKVKVHGRRKNGNKEKSSLTI